MKVLLRSFLDSVSLLVVCALVLNITFAQVMTSSNYQLQRDSINIGGGNSSSTSYVQESTVGEVGTGPSDSTSFSLQAGYQQMDEVYLSLSAPSNVVMDTDLGGFSGGTANGSTTVTVITDSPSGYQLTIVAENNPAMQRDGSTSIADYNDGGVPDFTFVTTASDAHFGFTPEGVDIAQAFLDDGGSCNVGSTDTSFACWGGLSTSERVIAQAASGNQPSGATTTVNFRVGIGGSAGVAAGLYIATTTLTALPL